MKHTTRLTLLHVAYLLQDLWEINVIKTNITVQYIYIKLIMNGNYYRFSTLNFWLQGKTASK